MEILVNILLAPASVAAVSTSWTFVWQLSFWASWEWDLCVFPAQKNNFASSERTEEKVSFVAQAQYESDKLTHFHRMTSKHQITE